MNIVNNNGFELYDGTDANERDINGRTTLYFGVRNGRTQFAIILVHNGTHIFRVTSKGCSIPPFTYSYL